jgi:hypothetical protein
MLRREREDASRDAQPAAPATTVAQLVQLAREAHKAKDCLRGGRAVKLYERALAVAEAMMMPRNSLVVAELANLAAVGHCMVHAQGAGAVFDLSAAARDAWLLAQRAAWCDDDHALPLSRRVLALLHARWRAGTLRTLTPHEREYFFAASSDDDDDATTQTAGLSVGTELYIQCAADAALMWPPLRSAAEDEARLRAIHGACCAALAAYSVASTDGRSPAPMSTGTVHMCCQLLHVALSSGGAGRGLLPRLRATCGMTRGEEARLRALACELQRHTSGAEEEILERAAAEARRAEADLARHGLRACALPGCGAREAHPKAFKVCGRCRRACYCSPAHQQQDWRRHKREEGCTQQAGQ